MSQPLTVMLVAAEASGDALGARLAQALRRRLGEGVRFVGVGGPKMAAEGVASPFDIGELSVLGLVEGLMTWRKAVRRANETVELAVREQPDVAVLIDSWGFTLRVATRLRKRLPGLKLVKYVGPQVWASRPGRAKTLSATVDLLLATQPLDAPFYEPHGLPVVFVGNPALARDFSSTDGARFREAIGAGPDEPVLLVLPGSRPSEIQRIMPIFEDTVNRLKAARPDLLVAVAAAGTVADTVKARVAGWPHRAHVIEDGGTKDDAMVGATVALACSGTVTTELALAGCPMVVGYRLGGLTYALLKPLFKPKWITLFNIAADREVAPEFLQDLCTPENLAEALAWLLDDPTRRASQIEGQFTALDAMGRGIPDPSEAAADAILALVNT
ncbi:lipid-A-disaccharide synthase [Caulobacter ginsengisoli]|uniref:Lipid-A-disaccharide synthase n=1 Tax=Caulobacter ginsengisoli TaxID=400775 RepID=A0ABU0ILY4_9CAUL|nr:lipid-A-disaccharide synthase [Caulobacter ginsengisoli]MDQ0463031.1 lipid-A-disaccharide synthase [Caulobacter ginsengisoli]